MSRSVPWVGVLGWCLGPQAPSREPLVCPATRISPEGSACSAVARSSWPVPRCAVHSHAPCGVGWGGGGWGGVGWGGVGWVGWGGVGWGGGVGWAWVGLGWVDGWELVCVCVCVCETRRKNGTVIIVESWFGGAVLAWGDEHRRGVFVSRSKQTERRARQRRENECKQIDICICLFCLKHVYAYWYICILHFYIQPPPPSPNQQINSHPPWHVRQCVMLGPCKEVKHEPLLQWWVGAALEPRTNKGLPRSSSREVRIRVYWGT